MDANLIIKNAPLIFTMAIVGVLGFMILLAVGLNMLRAERRPPGQPDPGWQLPAFLQRLVRRAPPAPAASAPPTPGADAAYEVLRVLRDRLTGRVVVEVGGRRYTTPAELEDANLRQGLQVTLADLQGFAGPASGAPPHSPATPVPPPPPPAPPSEPKAAAASAEPIGLNPLPPRPSPPPASDPVRVPSMNPFRQVRALREISAQPEAAPKSIAEQIDDLLQLLITGTPYAARNLRVRSGPQGNVLFEADGQAYQTVEEIPDAALPPVFREAIQRWEKSI